IRYAALGGNPSLSAKDIKRILGSVGIEADDDQLNKVISELNEKSIEDVITQDIGKVASVPAGGAVAVSAAPGTAAPAAGSTPAAAEEKRRRRRRCPKSQPMTWDLVSFIKFLLPCK
uniref:Large ribosomal subunit protein P2 n=1 Tax=Theropithecus gelada TaxID=9565 RepID=A0A8D2FLN3_THEGE